MQLAVQPYKVVPQGIPSFGSLYQPVGNESGRPPNYLLVIGVPRNHPNVFVVHRMIVDFAVKLS